MKSLKKGFISTSIIVASVLFVGCGSGGDDSSSSVSDVVSDTTPTSITTIDEAKEASTVAEVALNQNFMNPTASSGMNLSIQNSIRAISKAPTLAESFSDTDTCSNGGSVSYSGDQYNGIITYNNCDEGYGVQNGSVTQSSTDNSATLKFQGYSLSTGDITTKLNMTVVLNDFDPNDLGSENYTLNATVDGTIEATLSSNATYKYAYQNFHTIKKTTTEGYQTSLDGTMIVSTPCTSGVYNINTLSPLVYTGYSDYIDSGVLKINNATYTFYSPDVTIELDNGTTDTVSQDSLSENVECDI